MSGNIIEKNNSFEDYYNIDNLDDSELQAQLYAEIYYESNIEGAGTTDSSRTIKFDSITTERNVESERIQQSEEQSLKQPLASETTIVDSQKMPSTHQSEFAQIETLSSREMNPAHEYDNKSSEDSSVIQGKKRKENSPPKHRSSKHAKTTCKESSEKDNNDIVYSKYNVVSKCVKQKVHLLLAEQMNKNEDSSDSEDSILEVPVPPKPKPPLIDLQNSDEENDSNSGIDKNDLILKNWNDVSLKTYSRTPQFRNYELKTLQDDPQDTSSKSKNTARSYNKDTVNSGKSIRTSTCTQDFTEDIVLNCTTIQKGAKSISEITQLSKSAQVKQQSKSTGNTSQNSKKTLPLKGNNKNVNLQQETSVTSGQNLQTMQQNIEKSNNIYNLRDIEQNKSSAIGSCSPVINRKRRWDEVDDQSKQKRQCTIQQNNQNVIPQCSNTGEKRNISNEFFEPMSEEMKNYYNSSHGQENFDISKLQQGMSKDPRMWTILDEDLMPCPSSRRVRFWNVNCTNCHQEGHRQHDCPTPRKLPSCYMCGMKGHTEFRCPQKMCLTCGKPQNTFRNTCEYCRVLYCVMCGSVGHEQYQCPDLWRRYHQTTDMNSMPQDPGNVMKPSRLLYCCNCTKRGHESFTCKEYRWSENFPTPAAVTNYTDGLIYHPSSYPRPNSELNLSLSETTENETSIPQSSIDIQQTIVEDVESSVNLNTSENINFYISPASQEVEYISQTKADFASQEVEYISQTKDDLKSFIWPTIKKNFIETKVEYVKFSKVVCSYGVFRHKNDKDARMVIFTLNTFFPNTHQNFNMVRNLTERQTAPNFLKALLERVIEFEVNIGFIHRRFLSLQLIAMKDYIEHLYDLLKYWLSLPEDEKDYGIDVNLPINSTKMLNLLQSREPQLKKMRFRRYVNHIGGSQDDPRFIYKSMNLEKSKLEKLKQSAKKKEKIKYRSLRKMILRLQTKLLMISNTEPKPNVYVRTFQDVIRRFKAGLYQMNEKLDTATYLRLNLLYNQLFVPHTPQNVHKMLQRIELEEKKINDSLNQKLEICYVPEKQQEPEIRHIPTNEENLVCTSTVYTSSATPYTPPNINSENSSVINQQNNEVLNDEQNVDDAKKLEPSKIIDRNYGEIMITIKNPLAQNSEIMPLNTVPVKSKEPELNKGQLSTSEVRVDSKVPENKQDINVNNTPCLSRKESKKKLREERKLKRSKMNETLNSPKIHNVALDLIKMAYAFNLPYMMKAANEMQRHVNNRTIKPKHIRSLTTLIRNENRHKTSVQNICKLLTKK